MKASAEDKFKKSVRSWPLFLYFRFSQCSRQDAEIDGENDCVVELLLLGTSEEQLGKNIAWTF